MKKNFNKEYEQIVDNTKIIKVDVEYEMKHSFIAYAMAVNVSRAIPDVRDGLKPVHRRILYAMNELGLDYDKPTRKCARIVGDVLGKYHPHGDSAVYDALVRLAQGFTIRCPLVQGQGNFGSVDGDPAAAQRYTEAKLSKIAAEMLRDIDKKTVDFYPNFDDTLMQPSVLPARFPNLLVNGADGIAVGMATSIPPHNLGEVIDATIMVLKDPDVAIEELLKVMPCPDFPTGGLVLGVENMRKAYLTGRGGCIIRANTEIVEENGRSRIIVHELPYQTNKAQLIKYIADMVKDKKIDGISDINDESDRKGMRIVIDVKKDFNAQVLLNQLFKHTNLQVTYPMIFLALRNGVPTVMNLKEILLAYIDHQREVIVRRTKFDLEKAEEREHILKGLVVAQQNIDEVIEIIKKSSDKATAQQNLMDRFTLSERQATAILELRLQRLTALEVNKIMEELDQIEKLIIEYKAILADPKLVDEHIESEMSEIKEKYNTERRSELVFDYSELDIEDLIEREDIVITLTHENYIKRISASEYRAQHRGGVGVTGHKAKDEDFVEDVFVCSTHDDVYFFSNLGKVYVLRGYQIPEASKNARGKTVNNIINIADGEFITTILPVTEEQEMDGHLVLSTRKGKIKRCKLSEFESVRQNGKIAIKMDDDDLLVDVCMTVGGEELLIASSKGKTIRFSEDTVRVMGRTAYGVKSMEIDDDDYIVGMSLIKEGQDVLTITENGYGKRTDLSEYRLQGRGGKGVMAAKFNDKTGRIACVRTVNPDEDIIIVTDNGIIMRTAISEISKIGRTAQGVRIMKVGSGKVSSIAITPHEEIEEEVPAEGSENAEAVQSNAEGENTENTEVTENNEVAEAQESNEDNSDNE